MSIFELEDAYVLSSLCNKEALRLCRGFES